MAAKAPCPRCGRRRELRRRDVNILCGDCREVCAELNELDKWQPEKVPVA